MHGQHQGAWQRSSYCSEDLDACVEVAAGRNNALVRDSKDLTRPSVSVGVRAWSLFVTEIGQFR
ncbi:DUF397 domain-containing protein [Streptomyces sp. NPDC001492]